MNITQFFEKVLGAKLKNPRWSWGGRNPVSENIFLRVWEDQTLAEQDGEYVQIDWNHQISNSRGYAERAKQVEAIREGAQAWGVICHAIDPNSPGMRKIARFDGDRVAKLGGLKETNAGVYAKIVDYVDVKDLVRLPGVQARLSSDVRNTLEDKGLDATTKEALVNARLGQGIFRTKVLQLWSNRCAVTGSRTLDAVRASHIKPWRAATNEERLDPRNGLPLVASMDALFDAGLVSFDTSGRMLVSPKVPPEERQIFDLCEKALTKKPSTETEAYLEYHRSTI